MISKISPIKSTSPVLENGNGESTPISKKNMYRRVQSGTSSKVNTSQTRRKLKRHFKPDPKKIEYALPLTTPKPAKFINASRLAIEQS
jgi:hypothetical protein